MLRLPLAAAGAAAKRTTTAAASAMTASKNPALGAVAGIGSRRHVCEKLFIGGAWMWIFVVGFCLCWWTACAWLDGGMVFDDGPTAHALNRNPI